MSERSQPPVRVCHGRDGVTIYAVALAPDELPPVRTGDLQDAWETAREAAVQAVWGYPRLFRFPGREGERLDLLLADEDACCWAGAVDATVGIGSAYGLSLCLRLLALVNLLARADWAGQLCRIGRGGAMLHPALLRTAATSPLTEGADFHEPEFRSRLRGQLAPVLAPALPITGAAC